MRAWTGCSGSSRATCLTLSSLILLGGALGDRYGRRRVFVIGTIWFAAASLLCGIAPDLNTLIAARVLQGVGGALLTPGSLAILQASFRPDDRATAIGAWSGLGGVATALGPFVGGYLVESVSWRFIFLLNLPLAVAVVLVAVRHVPETSDEEARGIDVPGAVLAVLALGGSTYALISGPIVAFGTPRSCWRRSSGWRRRSALSGSRRAAPSRCCRWSCSARGNSRAATW